MIDQAYMDKVENRLSELEDEMARISASGKVKELRGVLAEHAHHKMLQAIGSRFVSLVKSREESQAILNDETADSDFKELAQAELEQIEIDLPKEERALRIALLPPDTDANRNILMEIRAGTGGDEAALFAGDLYRMYTIYAENKGWKTGVISASSPAIGGFKEIIFSVEGGEVYKTMRYESGGHRVQRIPVTEAGGRIHTSAATVAVLPEADEVDEIEIKPEDIRIDVFRASGAGGQHVNTTDSAVRITHLATNTVAMCQDERSQHRNKDKAMRVLKARLLDQIRTAEETKAADTRRNQIGSGDRSERIRTYNFPQNRVTDHRINLTLYNLDKIMVGELDTLLEPLYNHDIEQQLEKQLQL